MQDTHWNYKGALLVLESIFEQENITWHEPIFQWQTDQRIGDLALLSGIDNLLETYQYPDPKFEAKIATNSEFPDNWEYYKNKRAPQDITVLLLSDSFGMYLRDWLKMICTELIVVPNWTIRTTVIEKVQPDLVIYEMVERNIPSLFEIFNHP